MTSLKIFNLQGEETGEITLDQTVFGIEPNKSVIFDAIQVYRSNIRQGTSKTKKRDEVRGGGRKPWRQKGTGRARQGSIRSPQWRGGGIVFGPTGNKNYKIKQNKKERVLALKSALSIKAMENKIMAIENCELAEKKTKLAVQAFDALKITEKTLFIVGPEDNIENFCYASSNIASVGVCFYDELNTFAVVYYDNLVFTKGALATISEVFNG